LIWDNLHIPEEQKHRKGHSWEKHVNCVEWRSKDARRVKVYEQNRGVDYADYRIGLLYISAFALFVEGEPVITKLERKGKAKSDYNRN